MSLPTVLYDAAHTLLAGMLAEYAAAVATPGLILPTGRSFPPATQYVYAGHTPPAQCEAIVIGFDSLYAGAAGRVSSPSEITHTIRRAAQLSVTVFRCVATLSGQGEVQTALPTVAQLDDDAFTVLFDAFVVFNGIIKAHFDNNFFSYCTMTGVGPTIPLDQQGGIGGTKTLLSVAIE